MKPIVFHFSKTMSDLEYSILSEWFNWLVSYHDVKVDLIGKKTSVEIDPCNQKTCNRSYTIAIRTGCN